MVALWRDEDIIQMRSVGLQGQVQADAYVRGVCTLL